MCLTRVILLGLRCRCCYDVATRGMCQNGLIYDQIYTETRILAHTIQFNKACLSSEERPWMFLLKLDIFMRNQRLNSWRVATPLSIGWCMAIIGSPGSMPLRAHKMDLLFLFHLGYHLPSSPVAKGLVGLTV